MIRTFEVEIELCSDCVQIVANDDDSGCEDASSVRAELDARWAFYRLIVTCDGNCSFTWSDCDGCGSEGGTRCSALAVQEID